MNICYVSREYPPAPCGGIGTYLINIVALLAEKGHTIHVVTEWVRNAKPREIHGNIYIHRLPYLSHSAPNAELHQSAKQIPGAQELFRERDNVGAFALAVAHFLPQLIRGYAIDIVEAQEFEAPLYFFLSRRLLDSETPKIPCITHLHTPTDRCGDLNHENIFSRQFVHRYHYETASMRMADALLAPSHFIANELFASGQTSGKVAHVIPLPLGEVPEVADFESRSKTRILFTGRLERRKGVDTLFQAARLLLQRFPQLRFRFVGSDWNYAAAGMNWTDHIARRYSGEELAPFEFVGPKDRQFLWHEYASATVCCVPSLWENFPNTCIEALASGAPVVATTNGGMAEMIEDGVSGLLCPADDPEAVAEAIASVLGMPSSERANMGKSGANRIRALCNNRDIVERHEELYQRMIEDFDSRCLALPVSPVKPDVRSVAARRGGGNVGSSLPQVGSATTISVIVTCFNLGEFLDGCIKSVLAQSRPPEEIIIVDDGSTEQATIERINLWKSHPLVTVLRQRNRGLPTARNEGFRISQGDLLCFLDADDELACSYLEAGYHAFKAHAEVGVFSSWVENFGAEDGFWTPPHAHLPFLLLENTVATGAIVRRAAFEDAGGFKPLMCYGYEDWELWISIAELGWGLVTYPEALIRYRIRQGSMLQSITLAAHITLRRKMAEAHPELWSRFAVELSLLLEGGAQPSSATTQLSNLRDEVEMLRAKLTHIKWMLRRPHAGLSFVLRRIWRSAQRHLRRVLP